MGEIEIMDPVEGRNVTLRVLSSEPLRDGGTFHLVRYEAESGSQADSTFAVIDYGGNVVCQRDWQGACAEPDSVPEFDWVDCTPA